MDVFGVLEQVRGKGLLSYDSRSVVPGGVYVARVGESGDGHDYIDSVLDKVSFVLAQREFSHPRIVSSADLEGCISEFARSVRSSLDVPVVGITGSAGKTTTKRFLAAAALADVTPRSYNTVLGISEFLVNSDIDKDTPLVLEMGVSKPGDMSELVEVFAPDSAIFTNVGATHTLFLGSVWGVASEKAKIATGLASSGFLVTSDDPIVLSAVKGSLGVATHVTVGLSEMSNFVVRPLGSSSFSLSYGSDEHVVDFLFSGVHNMLNASYAVAAAVLVYGVDFGLACSRVAGVAPQGFRSEVVEYDGVKFLVDCYNASPFSSLAALDMLALEDGKKFAFLGRMAELADERAEHERVAEYARSLGIELVSVNTDLYGLPSYEGFIENYPGLVSGSVALVKGSRSSALEQFLGFL